MSNSTHNKPNLLGSACGIFAGSMVGWRAGQGVCGWASEHGRLVPVYSNQEAVADPGASHLHTFTHVIEVAGALGGGLVGYLIAAEKPLDAVFLAAATAATLAHGHSDADANDVAATADVGIATVPDFTEDGTAGTVDAMHTSHVVSPGDDTYGELHETSVHVLI